MKKFFTNFDLWISSALLSFMALLMFYEVIMRYLFETSSAVNSELCSLAFIWFIYFSMSHMTGKRAQITIELADLVFPKSWLKYVTLLADVIMLGFMILMAVNGVRLIDSVLEYSFVTPVLYISMIYPYAIIPIAFMLMTVKVLLLIIEDIRNITQGGH